MFYRMQHNMVSISPADYLAPVQSSRSRRSGHDQMYQVPYARKDVYKYSFSPGNCTCVELERTTSTVDPVWDTLLLD